MSGTDSRGNDQRLRDCCLLVRLFYSRLEQAEMIVSSHYFKDTFRAVAVISTVAYKICCAALFIFKKF